MRRAGSLLRSYGLTGVARRILLRLTRGVVTVHRILIFELRSGQIAPVAKRRLTLTREEAVVPKLQRLLPQRSVSSVRDRLERGHVCALHLDGSGKALACGWIAYDTFYEDGMERELSLSADEAILYDFYVAPEFRGQGAYPAMLREMAASARDERGVTCVYIATHSDNRSSQRGIAKADFRPCGSVLYFRIGPVRRWSGTRTNGIGNPTPWHRQ